MIKKINIIYLINLFLIKYIFIKFFKKNFLKNNLETNFLNLNFENHEILKKNFLSKKYLKFNKTLANEYFFHSFDCLSAAKKIGGADSIKLSLKHIFFWNKINFSFFSFAWNIEIASKRVTNLLYYLDIYGQNLGTKEEKILNTLINKHYYFIKSKINHTNEIDLSLNVTKSYLILSFIIGENTKKITKKIIKQINSLIDNNGCHKSYNFSKQAEFINDLIEIKNIFLYFDDADIEEINFQIINMTSLLANFFHKDNSIALFNGSNNFNIKLINELINKTENIKPKKLNNAKNGIVSYADKNKSLFFDITKPTNKTLNQNLHAGTLSFEFSYKDEKIITNCGSIEKRIGKKPEYLRFSAAHSTIIVNNTNISELIEKSSYKRAPKTIKFDSVQNDKNIFLEGSHDGYLKNFNIIVKRKIIISKISDEILGSDFILSMKNKFNKTMYDIRFHLVPNCKCLLTNDKKSVLIKTKNNRSWVFSAKSELYLENSVYIGDGKKIEQNQQIVITKFLKNIKQTEEWSLKKI